MPRLAIVASLALCSAACSRPVVFQTGPTPCATDSECTAGGSCATDADCAGGATCDPIGGACVVSCDTFTHMCLRGESCTSDMDCPFGSACDGGDCVRAGPPGCGSAADCPDGMTCDVGSGTCK
jgi:hypothetical protein